MIKSGPERPESVFTPPMTNEEIHVSSLDQIPFRNREFGKMNVSQMDQGLNISFNFPEESKDDQLLLYLTSVPNNLMTLPCAP